MFLVVEEHTLAWIHIYSHLWIQGLRCLPTSCQSNKNTFFKGWTVAVKVLKNQVPASGKVSSAASSITHNYSRTNSCNGTTLLPQTLHQSLSIDQLIHESISCLNINYNIISQHHMLRMSVLLILECETSKGDYSNHYNWISQMKHQHIIQPQTACYSMIIPAFKSRMSASSTRLI